MMDTFPIAWFGDDNFIILYKMRNDDLISWFIIHSHKTKRKISSFSRIIIILIDWFIVQMNWTRILSIAFWIFYFFQLTIKISSTKCLFNGNVLILYWNQLQNTKKKIMDLLIALKLWLTSSWMKRIEKIDRSNNDWGTKKKEKKNC